MIKEIPILDRYTDKETDNLGKFSSNLFTLNTFYKANKRALKGFDSKQYYSELVHIWNLIIQNIIPLNEMDKGEISKKALRETFIVTQGVVIQALGIIVASCFHDSENSARLLNLKTVNWRRNNGDWQLRTIKANGRIISNNKAVLLTSNMIKREIGIELTNDEQSIENQFLQEITIGKEYNVE